MNHKLFFSICLSVLSFQILFSQDSLVVSEHLQNIFLVDAHVHVGLKYENGIVKSDELEYFSDRGLNAFIFGMPVDRSRTDNLLARITEEVKQIQILTSENPGMAFINSNRPELSEISSETVSLFLSIEYFHGVFRKNLVAVQAYKNLGIRFITLIDNSADGIFEKNATLSSFGKQLIDEMNRIGIGVDVSHLSGKKLLDVINYSKSPVIASHSAAYSISGENGTLSNKALAALKENSGYVMLTFNESDLFGDRINNGSGFKQLLKHIDHIRKYVGIERIGIGTDYQAAGKYIPQDMNHKQVIDEIKKNMLTHGYSEQEINGVLGLNLMDFLNYLDGSG